MIMVILNKFQSITERLMTVEEIQVLAKEMDLTTPMTTTIINTFLLNAILVDETDGKQHDMCAGNGRLLVSSKTFTIETLCLTDPDASDEQLDAVFNAFFGTERPKH